MLVCNCRISVFKWTSKLFRNFLSRKKSFVDVTQVEFIRWSVQKVCHQISWVQICAFWPRELLDRAISSELWLRDSVDKLCVGFLEKGLPDSARSVFAVNGNVSFGGNVVIDHHRDLLSALKKFESKYAFFEILSSKTFLIIHDVEYPEEAAKTSIHHGAMVVFASVLSHEVDDLILVI